MGNNWPIGSSGHIAQRARGRSKNNLVAIAVSDEEPMANGTNKKCSKKFFTRNAGHDFLNGNKDFSKLAIFARILYGKLSARKREPRYRWPGRWTSKLCEDQKLSETVLELFRNDGHKM